MGLPEPLTGWGRALPYDNNNAIEDVVGVPDVSQWATGQQLQQHLQGKHAGEHNVAYLQCVSQLVGLWVRRGSQDTPWFLPFQGHGVQK